MNEQHKTLKEYLINIFPDYTWKEVENLIPITCNTLQLSKKKSFESFLKKNYAELLYSYEKLLQRIPKQYQELITIDFQSFAEHLFRCWDINGKNVLSGVEI